MNIHKEALDRFDELRKNLSEEELNKFAKDVIENSGDTSFFYDVAAGADPTNVLTYNAAKINKGDHLKHRVIQDTSSFGIATVGDAAITGAGALSAALAMKIPYLKNKFPEVAKKLSVTENAEGIGAAAIGAGVISGTMEGFATDMLYRKSLEDKEKKHKEIQEAVSKLACLID